MSTLSVPPMPPSPRDDAINLYRAFKGFGCDTSVVINILAHRDATQRAYIQQDYRTMYSSDLLKRLSSELTGKLEVATRVFNSGEDEKKMVAFYCCLGIVTRRFVDGGLWC
ncbi:hypothetical protein L6164_028474 [Bauhinia variegata]|uniref:Uncharacterized protein n=1 Tax=Bauhinia variegata TaxID=167791 RepID=A0ACB9L6A4_BAUVA|nr:hypothetical protein L6164_028474 [Bauhinia variegata]